MRRPNELTSEYLKRTLQEIGLRARGDLRPLILDLAHRASLGHFDDFSCPEEVDDGMNMLRLVRELALLSGVAVRQPAIKEALQGMVRRVQDGDFDGTAEESARWAVSRQGQETFRMLAEGE